MSDTSVAEIQRFQPMDVSASQTVAIHHDDEVDRDNISEDEGNMRCLRVASERRWRPEKNSPQTPCASCGRNYSRASCRFKMARCGKKGHLTKVC